MIAKKTIFFFAKTVLIGELLIAGNVSYSAQGLEGDLTTKEGRSVHLDRIEAQLNQLQENLDMAFSYTLLPHDDERLNELQNSLQNSSRISRQLSERVSTYRTILSLVDTGTRGRRSSTQAILSLTHNKLRMEREIERLRMENARLQQKEQPKEKQEVTSAVPDSGCFSMTAWGEMTQNEKKIDETLKSESTIKLRKDSEREKLLEEMQLDEDFKSWEESEREKQFEEKQRTEALYAIEERDRERRLEARQHEENLDAIEERERERRLEEKQLEEYLYVQKCERERRLAAKQHQENLDAIENSELEEAIKLSLSPNRFSDELLEYHQNIKEIYEMVETLRHAYDFDEFSSQFPTTCKEQVEKIHHVIRSEFSKKILPFLNEAKESYLLGQLKVCPLYRSYPNLNLKIDKNITNTLKDDECHLVHEMLEVGNILDTLDKDMGLINKELFAKEVADSIVCEEDDDEVISLREGFSNDLKIVQTIITKFEKLFGIQIAKDIASSPVSSSVRWGVTMLSSALPENFDIEAANELL